MPGKSLEDIFREEHDFWKGVGRETGLKLEDMELQYSRNERSPWFKAVDKESGAAVMMSSKPMYGSITVKFKKPIPESEFKKEKFNYNLIYISEDMSKNLIHYFGIHVKRRAKEEAVNFINQALKFARKYSR